MSVWDAPNQQVVRADESAPWEEGTGGGGAEVREASELDELSKDELLELARVRGVSPANATMTKDELKAAIEAA